MIRYIYHFYYDMKSILLIIIAANLSYGFQITFPTFKKNLAVITNIDLNKITQQESNEFKLLFKSVPMLLFKDQKINSKKLYEFCRSFDDKANDKIIHPFKYSEIEGTPHVSLRGEGHIKNKYGVDNLILKYSDPFKYTMVWHQDIVGHGTYLPPVVSSIYMLEKPDNAGDTIFASLEDAYDSMEFYMKNKLKKYNVIYSNTRNDMMNSYFDYTGTNRVLNDKTQKTGTSIITREPLIVYSNKEKRRKALMLSPFRFNKFDKLSCDESFDMYREIMNKYIITPNNMINIMWDKNDLLIFNNRKLIHTSTPTIEYQGKNRIYYSCFVGTSEPIIRPQ